MENYYQTPMKLLASYLESLNVEYIFGVPGKGIMPIYDYLHDLKTPTPILASHESGAAFMALSWATLAQKIGVCVATTGPGATNLLTGTATAYYEGIPLLVLTGQTPLEMFNRRAYQESSGHSRSIDTVNLFKSITKKSALALSADHLVSLIRKWIPLAINGRPGPVHIAVPWDIWDTKLTKKYPENINNNLEMDSIISNDSIQKVKHLIKTSKNCVLITGRGLAFSHAGDQAIKFAENWNLPIISTVRGKGALPNSSNYIGYLGPSESELTLAWLEKNPPDTVIAVGTSLGMVSLGKAANRIQPPQNVIQVNIDDEELGAVWDSNLFILSDSKNFFQRMNSENPEPNIGIRQHDFSEEIDYSEYKDGLHPQGVMAVIRDTFPADTTYLPDSGNHWLWAMRTLRSNFQNSILPGRVLGAMGQATAGVVGAKLALEKNKPVVAITGDGSFLMHGTELATSVNYGINVIWIIINNKALGRIYSYQQTELNGRIISTKLPEIDFTQIARGFGLWSKRVETYSELKESITLALKQERPCLIDVAVSREIVPPS